ncbi:44714eb7-64f2-44e6-a1e7-50fdbc1f5e1f [Thermothielavioides terrestris]|jgi:hypothetical protein
MYI